MLLHSLVDNTVTIFKEAAPVFGGALAFFTAALAFSTWRMAGATKEMTEATVALGKQEQQRHVENLMPICSLVLPSLAARDNAVSAASAGHFKIPFSIQNTGQGPALNLHIIIRFYSKMYEIQREVAPLGQGQERMGMDLRGVTMRMTSPPLSKEAQDMVATLDPTFWLINAPLGPTFDENDFSTAADGDWDIYLTYTDVFETAYYTKHSKNPKEPWTVFKKGHPMSIQGVTDAQ